MKAYTDIEQSKKLAGILPIESADMCYRIVAYNPNDTHEYQPYCFSSTLESDIPCWSLAALIGILPYGCLTIHVQKKYRVIYNPNTITEGDYDNPVDACVEMIIKLHDLNLL